MIKINLATRKQSGLVGDAKGARGGGAPKVNFDQFKGLPLRQIAVPAVACFFASYLLDGYKEEEIQKADAQIANLNATTQKLQAEINKYKSYESIKKALEEDEVTIKTKLDTIKKLIADRGDPPKILLSVATAIPQEVWLSEFTIERANVSFKGASMGFNQISDFMKSLNENVFFSNVTLKNTQQSKEEPGTEGATEMAVFELEAKRRQ